MRICIVIIIIFIIIEWTQVSIFCFIFLLTTGFKVYVHGYEHFP